jgi:hypothetical protein
VRAANARSKANTFIDSAIAFVAVLALILLVRLQHFVCCIGCPLTNVSVNKASIVLVTTFNGILHVFIVFLVYRRFARIGTVKAVPVAER